MENDHFVCPWRAGPILTASIRKLFHNPRRILSPYLADGITAMDVGCGMGFFTIPMSDMVGKNGNVIAVDLQAEMLEGLKKNAEKAGAENITRRQCAQDSLRIKQWNGTVDFALVFWMLHEVPDPKRLIKELYAALSPNGKLLFAEPLAHVNSAAFQTSVKMITESGLKAVGTPKIPVSRAVLFSIKKVKKHTYLYFKK